MYLSSVTSLTSDAARLPVCRTNSAYITCDLHSMQMRNGKRNTPSVSCLHFSALFLQTQLSWHCKTPRPTHAGPSQGLLRSLSSLRDVGTGRWYHATTASLRPTFGTATRRRRGESLRALLQPPQHGGMPSLRATSHSSSVHLKHETFPWLTCNTRRGTFRE